MCVWNQSQFSSPWVVLLLVWRMVILQYINSDNLKVSPPPSLCQRKISLSHAFPKTYSIGRHSNIWGQKLLNTSQLELQSISTLFFYFHCIIWKKPLSSLHILKGWQFFPADFASFSCYASIRLFFASTDKHHRIKLPQRHQYHLARQYLQKTAWTCLPEN